MSAVFDIPAADSQSTAGARRAYFEVWKREWPHEDADLRELARMVPSSNDLRDYDPKRSRCAFLLERMREWHEFTPELETIGAGVHQ